MGDAPKPTQPILVFACGNPSRGDDAIGPLMIERLQRAKTTGHLRGVDLLSDFQLQVEHALDLRYRRRVIFVDAAAGLEQAYRLSPVVPGPAASWTTHSLTPSALAGVYCSLFGTAPRLEMLAIAGEGFELGAELSARARDNLAAASRFLIDQLYAEASGARGPASPHCDAFTS